MLRKQGKSWRDVGLDYGLEYGPTASRYRLMRWSLASVWSRGRSVGDRRTMAAGIALLRLVGAVVPAAAALIELTFLGGRAKLDVTVETLISYDS